MSHGKALSQIITEILKKKTLQYLSLYHMGAFIVVFDIWETFESKSLRTTCFESRKITFLH